MKYFYVLLDIMEQHDFSIEMLNYLKDVFQLGGWDIPDFERFSKLFYLKTKRSGIKLTDEKMEQVLQVIYERGVLNLEDIFFIDGASLLYMVKSLLDGIQNQNTLAHID